MGTGVAISIGHYLYVFGARHWLLTLVNTILTAAWGLGVLRLYRRFVGLPLLKYLQMTYLVLLGSLFKGAFYLVMGDNRGSHAAFITSFQIPDPIELLRITPQTRYSVWQPTPALIYVSVIMISVALFLLIFRAYRVYKASRSLKMLAQFSDKPERRMDACLKRAAEALDLPAGTPMPEIVLVELNHPTPLLLGVMRPSLVLSPFLANCLTDEELEALFRHELAHLKRRDHIWRWLMIWVQDISYLNPFTRYIAVKMLETEEQLCDLMAVRSAADAQQLANAIVQAHRAAVEQVHGSALLLPPDVVPSLLGRNRRKPSDVSALSQRVESLLHLAHELNDQAKAQNQKQETLASDRHSRLSPSSQKIGLFLLKVVLFVILYGKFIFILCRI